MRRFAALLISLLLPWQSAIAATTVTGTHQEVLTAEQTVAKSGQEITVTGAHFDESVGIYLAYCVKPKVNNPPTPCGGGINKAGVGDTSYWISSNPPPYGQGLAKPYKPGGRFREKVKVLKKIGNFDCTKVTCAITVRADHLNSNDRSFDIFIPIQIKK